MKRRSPSCPGSSLLGHVIITQNLLPSICGHKETQPPSSINTLLTIVSTNITTTIHQNVTNTTPSPSGLHLPQSLFNRQQEILQLIHIQPLPPLDNHRHSSRPHHPRHFNYSPHNLLQLTTTSPANKFKPNSPTNNTNHPTTRGPKISVWFPSPKIINTHY